jgi:hypothetical protein
MFISGRRNKIFLVLQVILLSVVFSGSLLAQCCSTGSPVGASVNVGVLQKQTIRVIGFYRNSYSDTYYAGNHTTDDNTALSCAYYNFAGITVGYGITKRLTVEADIGYFFNKTQVFKQIDYKETGYGVSNGDITVKYGFIEKPLKQIELMGGIGFRYPFTTTPQMIDGVQLSPDVQPSTHTFGLSGILFFSKGFPEITLRTFTINKYDYNFPDKFGYKYGNILMDAVFVSKKAFTNFFCILQLRSELKSQDQDDGKDREDTGYWLITVTPQVSYSIVGKWNISVLYDIPVYKNYHGKQLTPRYSFAVSLSHDINLGRKARVSTLPPGK